MKSEAHNSKFETGVKFRHANHRKNRRKWIFLGFLVVIFYFSSFISHFPVAYAEGISLRLSPSEIVLQATPPTDLTIPLTLENTGETPLTLVPTYRIFRQSDKQNGEVQFAPSLPHASDPAEKIFDSLSLTLDNTTITSLSVGPGETAHPLLHISLSAPEPVSDYYFSLIFLATQQGSNTTPTGHTDSYTNITGGVATNILLSLGKKLPPTYSVDEFSTPWYREGGPISFILKISNEGTQFVSPKGNVLITNMFGQLVGNVDIPPTIILANSSRYLTNDQSAQAHTDLPKMIWRERYLLGFYTLTLNLYTSENKLLYQRSIHVLTFPTQFLFGLFAVIALLVIIGIKIKAKIER